MAVTGNLFFFFFYFFVSCFCEWRNSLATRREFPHRTVAIRMFAVAGTVFTDSTECARGAAHRSRAGQHYSSCGSLFTIPYRAALNARTASADPIWIVVPSTAISAKGDDACASAGNEATDSYFLTRGACHGPSFFFFRFKSRRSGVDLFGWTRADFCTTKRYFLLLSSQQQQQHQQQSIWWSEQ